MGPTTPVPPLLTPSANRPTGRPRISGVWLRRGLAGLVAVSLMLAGILAIHQASAEDDVEDRRSSVAAYLPTYVGERELTRLAHDSAILNHVNQLHIAFGLPDKDGRVEAPTLSQAYLDIVKHLDKETKLSLSVGGWSIGGSREKMVANLHAALRDPDAFVESVLAAREDVARQLGRQPDTIGIGLDLEWPSAKEADETVKAAAKLKAVMTAGEGGGLLTMAIPTSYNRGGFDLRSLAGHVDVFEVMTYDYSVPDGSGGRRAGYIAPQEKVIDEIDEVVAAVGDASKVAVGFPDYGWLFEGATAIGQEYSPVASEHSRQILLKDVPSSAIAADGQAVVRGAVTSLVTPGMARATMAKLYARHPNLAGAFVWPLNGATAESMQALSSQR